MPTIGFRAFSNLVLMVFSLLLLILAMCFMTAGNALAQDLYTPKKLDLHVGESVVVDSSEPFSKVSVSDPQVIGSEVLDPRSLYLTGKTPGMSTIILRSNGEKAYAIYEVRVAPNVMKLKEKLYEIFPEETNIGVVSSQNRITLTGTVSSADKLDRIKSIAETFAPCPKKGGQAGPDTALTVAVADGEEKCSNIINMLSVAGVQQVMLEVRVSEISRSMLKRLGFNFSYLTSGGNFGVSLLNNLTTPVGFPVGGIPPVINSDIGPAINISKELNALFRFNSNDTTWTAFIDALKEQGLIKILAEPTLMALSGQTASFLAGGEFPIPVPQDFNTITVEYKPFGVGLTFTPVVLDNEKISMRVAPEVSELDFSRPIVLEGFLIPSLTTRRVSTVIELKDGQSFAIAGLLQENLRENVSKFPVLGDIPVLGALFRSSNFIKNETELLVIVTPHLVKPLEMSKQTLPTDQFSEPSDLEFFLFGRMEGKGRPESMREFAPPAAPGRRESGLEGEFGHIVPSE